MALRHYLKSGSPGLEDFLMSEIPELSIVIPALGEAENLKLLLPELHKELKEMDKQERIRACYMHACLRYVTRKKMTNASLRERFGIESQNASEASRFLKEAIESGDILLQDASVGNRSRQYLPFWAGSTTGSP